MIKAETWTRYWVQMEQRGDSWERMTMWVADENRGPVKIIDRLELEVGLGLDSFQLEFNSSNDRATRNRGDLVTYVRNVAIMRDYGDPSNLLVRPVAGVAPPPRPRAVENVRIVSGS